MRRIRGLVVVAGLGIAALVLGAYDSGHPGSPAADPAHGPAAPAARAKRKQVLERYADLPLGFVKNRGQTDGRVRYYARGAGYAFFLTPEKILLSFVTGSKESQPGAVDAAEPKDPAPDGVALALRFLEGDPQVALEARGRVPGEVNYFKGNDRASRYTRLPQRERVTYHELWPGIDLMLRGRGGELKYEFRVRPGARVEDIRLAYSGANGVALDDTGGLSIDTDLGVLRDSPPVSYQEIDGRRVPVKSRYILTERAEGAFGFAVGRGFQEEHELIIDPGLKYSTFLGGTGHDLGTGIATDAAGNAYVTGTTFSTDFPTTPRAFDGTLASSNDVFVAKLNATGSALVYSTYLGGTPTPVPAGGSDPFEFGRGIAVDSAGNAYVTGQTTSSNFPTTPRAFDRTLNVGTFDATDAFVTKLNATGSGLVYSTFLGGTDIDDALGIDVDGSGNAYVTGQIASGNFPTTPGAFDTSANGGFDAFATKLNATGSDLIYSTYLGGADNELGSRVAVDDGTAFVGGSTRSAGFPTTSGAFDTSANGGFDAFATKVNAAGSGLIYSTFLGGANIDFGDGLAIDAAGNTYLSGGTLSSDFPTTSGAFDRTRAGSDAFVTKLNDAGSALVYSTFLGGAGGEGAAAIAVNASNRAWVTGGTSSANFPTRTSAIDRSLDGPSDVFVARLNATGSRLPYSTFLGGSGSENGRDIALDAGAEVYVTGETQSADFPTTPGAFDRVFNGDPAIFWGDGFVTKLGL